MRTDYTVIFDNGGGITIQLPGWAGVYYDNDRPAYELRAARDTLIYALGLDDPTTWDGDDPAAAALTPAETDHDVDGAEIAAFVLPIIEPGHPPPPEPEDYRIGVAGERYLRGLRALATIGCQGVDLATIDLTTGAWSWAALVADGW